MTPITDHIILELDGVILINKPRQIPTAGNTLDDPGSMQFMLMAHYRRKIWAVHQLDKLTTGLNVFVRKKALVQAWAELLKRGQKQYLAICEGRVQYDHFYIKEPLGWHPEKKCRGVMANGQSAKTEVTVLARHEDKTLVRIALHTGRTHQIRIHLSHHGHPILGDALYGHGDGVHPLALHAWRLITAQDELFEAPLPDPWPTWLASFQYSVDTL